MARPDPINDFYAGLEGTVYEFRMLSANDKILAAVSGGPDSVALLLGLLHLRSRYGLTLGVAHLNHLLRGKAADEDEDFVRSLTDSLGLTLHSERRDVAKLSSDRRLSLEETGRQARYEFFLRTATRHGYTRIATGHNRNDNAEMVLINLLRGSGLKGLSGIPPVRNHIFIRPLIQTARQAILDFLSAVGRDFRTDASNDDPAFMRNAVRHRLIPFLESGFNPDIIGTLNRLSRLARIENDCLDDEAEKRYQDCRISQKERSVCLSRSKLAELDPALQNRVVRKALLAVKKDLRQISFGHVHDILDFCLERASGNSLDLPDRIRVYKKKNEIVIQKENRPLREIGRQEKQGKNSCISERDDYINEFDTPAVTGPQACSEVRESTAAVTETRSEKKKG